MQKIMFNDRFGLTEAVLKGTKTMTRRFIKQLLNVENPDISDWGLKDGGKAMITLYEGGRPMTDIFPMYQPGEVVAVAQRYCKVWKHPFTAEECLADEQEPEFLRYEKGWDNKMFIKPAYMPHRIEIANIKVERLQDISDEDSLKEGIFRDDIDQEFPFVFNIYGKHTACWRFSSPREAYAALIDKMSGKGTWQSNPFVFVYTFKLIK